MHATAGVGRKHCNQEKSGDGVVVVKLGTPKKQSLKLLTLLSKKGEGSDKGPNLECRRKNDIFLGGWVQNKGHFYTCRYFFRKGLPMETYFTNFYNQVVTIGLVVTFLFHHVYGYQLGQSQGIDSSLGHLMMFNIYWL